MVQHFITPLYYLYDFCVKNQIPDLKQITLAEEKAFYEYLDTNMDAISKNAPQVLYRARKFLFLSDKKPDFTATCWFLEKFTLSDRKNPTIKVLSSHTGSWLSGMHTTVEFEVIGANEKSYGTIKLQDQGLNDDDGKPVDGFGAWD